MKYFVFNVAIMPSGCGFTEIFPPEFYLPRADQTLRGASIREMDPLRVVYCTRERNNITDFEYIKFALAAPPLALRIMRLILTESKHL